MGDIYVGCEKTNSATAVLLVNELQDKSIRWVRCHRLPTFCHSDC